MIVTPIKTRVVIQSACTIEELLDESLSTLPEASVVAIASKVVALCEGRVQPIDSIDKDKLVEREAHLFMPSSLSRYGVSLSIARDLLLASAGVDESNGNGNYVLWPSDSQASANKIRAYLQKRFGLKKVGVILTDSATRPLQWGTTGIALAHSGFVPLRDYIGTKDLFGLTFVYQKNNIQNGLAAAAALVGGEGAEQTPIVILSDLDFVDFIDRDPTAKELEDLKIDPKDDLYGLMLSGMPWQKGQS
jgi:dihydrofolate synthase / folylpolyglutamate synthase